MHNYKRTELLIFILSFYFLLNLNLKASSGDEDKYLDSIYYNYLAMHGMSMDGKYPSLEDRIPSEEDHKCGFGLVSAVVKNYEKFSLSRQKVIKDLFARPQQDASIVSPSGKFRIHYSTIGTSVPNYDQNLSTIENVNQVALAFDSAYYFEVNSLGYLFPPADNGEGGDNLYDVYIIDAEPGTYGETIPGEGGDFITYIEIEKDFLEDDYTTHGLEAMRVTAAHEFHHAIQVGNYGGLPITSEELFFFESTSAAMEEFVFDDVNDYYDYLGYYFIHPNLSFPQYSDSKIGRYSLAIWNIFLVEKYGFEGHEILKRQWELRREKPVPLAMEESFTERGKTLKNELNDFGIWAYFSGYRKRFDDNNEYFEEGANYPTLRLTTHNYDPSGISTNLSVQVFANSFIRFFNSSSGDSITVIISNSNSALAANNPSADVDVRLDLSGSSSSGFSEIQNKYFWRLNSSEPIYFFESGILNNLPPSRKVLASIVDAYPVPFNYNRHTSIVLPAFSSETRFADVKIFTISMDLVYEGKMLVKEGLSDDFVNWDGLDSNNNKLPTGVYIFITSSDEQLKTGKIVIQNE